MMKVFSPGKRQEGIIYGILWGIVFALVPVVIMFQAHSGGLSFRFADVTRIWLGILPFFVLFLVHDLVVAPLWVEKGKVWAYLAAMVVLLLVFGGYLQTTRRGPDPMHREGPPPMERMEEERPPMDWNGERMPPRPAEGEHSPGNGGMPMTPELLKFLLGLLLLGVNLGMKYYLKSIQSDRRMQELKAENLERQLETLRYQINPHFFMNTLNNIHALVDIDPEQAKVSIEEFSKLMRFILYEGDRPTIPLSRELEFLRHYVTLMKMRYDDTVRISLSLPEDVPSAEIPPLVLGSFVENAFKHGISYEKPSFVRVSVSVEDGRIAFKCVNSRQSAEQVRSHGVGLSNVRGRLDLLYGDGYTLHIDQNDEVYDILLLLPMTPGPKEGLSV